MTKDTHDRGRMTMNRPDSGLIRHFAESGRLPAALAWQAAPYILLPGEGFVGHLWARRDDWQHVMPDAWQLPWDEAVYDLEAGRRPLLAALHGADLATDPQLDRGRLWLRVATLDRYLAAPSTWSAQSAALLAPFRRDAARWLAVEVWEETTQRQDGTTGFPPYPDVSLIPRDTACWDWRAAAHLYPNPQCRTGRAYGAGFCNLDRCQFEVGDARMVPCLGSESLMAAGVMLALWTLAYLYQTDDYLTEVAPRGREGQAPRTGTKKPWTRALSHYILIDPGRVREYRPEHGTSDSERAERTPHQRRGHWRELRADRFARSPDGTVRRVRVRPAWIGESAWEHAGQRYRVVPPRD